MTGEVTYRKEGGSSRALIGILLLGFCVAIAAVIVLAVLLTNQMKDGEHVHSTSTTAPVTAAPVASTADPCAGKIIDVAVVGAGVSGVYSAYKLTQKYDHTIHIFEAQDRIGGRTFSVDMPGISDFKADIGAMRFYRNKHKRLMKLAETLGLTVQPFNTPNENNTLYYLRGQLLSKTEVATGDVPYDMTDKERELSSDISALHAYWNNMIIANDSKTANAWDRVCTDGKRAYEKGIHNAFLEVGSPGAIEYTAQLSGFPGDTYNNVNYAEWSDSDYTGGAGGAPEQKHTFKEGFQELTLRMMEEILQHTRNQLFKNHELVSLSHNGTVAMLKIIDRANHKEVDVCARDVVLGLPSEALKRINFLDGDMSVELAQLLPGVKQAPASKTFLVYRNAWWRHLGRGPIFERLRADGINVSHIITDLPAGQILDVGVDSETGKAMLLIYNDWWNNIQFWSSYMINGERHNSEIESEYIASQKIIKQVNLQLAKVFNLSVTELPQPDVSVSHAWFEAPYWTAWHDKTPGYHFPTVMEKVLKPVQTKGVYIVGEAFSNHYTWVEGALETAQTMLTQHFDVDLE